MEKQRLAVMNLLHPSEYPELDLYMDQVITFMEKKYPEKPLTKTMINNYTKDRLLFPPTKKKYGREHLMLLSLIQILKRTLSLPDIKVLLGPLAEACGRGQTQPLHDIYLAFKARHGDMQAIGEESLAKILSTEAQDAVHVLCLSLVASTLIDGAAARLPGADPSKK